MGTLKIGSAKNMVGVTIEPKTVLFNGDNVKYIKSGLTEIWGHIQPLVPTLTSNIGKDGGEASISTSYLGTQAYALFDNNKDSIWHSTAGVPQWVQYKFTAPTIVKSFRVDTSPNGGIKAILQASNDNSSWKDLSQLTDFPSTNTTYNIDVNNEQYYLYYRLYIPHSYYVSGGSPYVVLTALQFYGSKLKGLIPTMTSNTTPSGKATCSTMYDYNHDAWKAFDGNIESKGFVPSPNDTFGNAYVQYEFEKPIRASFVGCQCIDPRSNINHIYKLQASNNGEDFETLVESVQIVKESLTLYATNTNKAYKYYRFVYMSNDANDITVTYGFKFQLYR